MPAASRVGVVLGRILGDAARSGATGGKPPETAGGHDPSSISDATVEGLAASGLWVRSFG